MKPTSLFLAMALFVVCPLATSAQGPARPLTQPMPGTAMPGGPPRQLGNVSPDLKRFDLDFPGGTPGELAAAIGKAQGRQLNVIIPAAQAETKLMPLKVSGVTVNQLFQAIEMASARSEPQITSFEQNGDQVQQKRLEYREVHASFVATSNEITDDTVWSFRSNAPTAAETAMFAKLSQPVQSCQYFQLAPYLEERTVEDITTAIETGWKMLGVDPMPKLSFHPETKLLIAVGSSTEVAQIPAVLKQLQFDDTPRVEKMAGYLAESDALKAKPVTAKELERLQEIETLIRKLQQTQRARDTLRQSLLPPQPPPLRPATRQ